MPVRPSLTNEQVGAAPAALIAPNQLWRMSFRCMSTGSTFWVKKLDGDYVVGQDSWMDTEERYKKDYLLAFYRPVRPELQARFDRMKLCLA